MPALNDVAISSLDFGIPDYYNIYSGKGVLSDPIRYLRRPSRESDDSYRDRSKWATFPNWPKKSHTIFMGYVFSAKPKIENPDPDFSILDLTTSTTHHALIGGFCWILILPPPKGPAVYRADKIISQNEKGTFKVFGEKHTWLIKIDIETGVGTITDEETGKSEPFKEEQLIKVSYNESSQSLFVDIAPMAIDIFNLASARRYLIYQGLIWFIEGPSTEEPEPFSYITRSSTDDPETRFITPDDVTKIKSITDEIKESIMEIGSVLGISSEFARELRFQAGISKMIDLIDTASIVKSIAGNVTRAANQASIVFAGMKGSEPATIELDPVLKPMADEEKMSVLKQAADFINVPAVTIELQKEFLTIALPGKSEKEILPFLEMIEKAGGIMSNPFASFPLPA